MRTIEIGLNVHKAIEAGRVSLGETENDILERLLRTGGRPSIVEAQPRKKEPGRDWEKDGVVLPEGTKLRAAYSGQSLSGEVVDGAWVVNGRVFRTPSMALIHNVVTKDGRRTNINGWNHWDVKRPADGAFVSLRMLRDAAKS